MNVVFTPRSLQLYLSKIDGELPEGASVPSDGSWQLVEIANGDSVYIFDREDDSLSTRIVLMDNGQGIWGDLPPGSRRQAAQRAHRSAIGAEKPPLHFPRDWKAYHEGNLVAFFAAHNQSGEHRWLMETTAIDEARVVCFWKITAQVDEVLLQDFHPDRERLESVLRLWEEKLNEAAVAFEAIPPPSTTEALQNSIDLELVSYGAVTQYRNFRNWMELITDKQREFVEHPTDKPVKLRGPAGSGKTLAMELKVLNEVYQARDQSKDLRVLYATHSWAMADQVDNALRQMDESQDLSNIEVLPLVFIAEQWIGREKTLPRYLLLGEDSLSGKKMQLERISETVKSVVSGDWLTFRSRVSDELRVRVEASSSTLQHAGLIWDLMNEFSSVLSANGIFPGVNAERKYLAVPRSSWMMPVGGANDLRFILHVYSKYIAGLAAENYLTSDQVINDFHNYLETFAWNLRRVNEGYDLIFVDEMHLFNEQERLVLHYLTRSADSYPAIFMALDPRQAPNEVYANYSFASVRVADSGEADTDLGKVDSVELSIVHRFSPQILALVRHVNSKFPALDLGPDWELDLTSIKSASSVGEIPEISVLDSADKEHEAMLEDARTLMEGMSVGERVAVVLLDPLKLDAVADLAKQKGLSVCVVRGRDDLDQLRYVKKSLVLTAAEYVGGLQFHAVVCGGFPVVAGEQANVGYQIRRLLSLFYLAVSRATDLVHVFVNDSGGGIPSVLETALGEGVLKHV